MSPVSWKDLLDEQQDPTAQVQAPLGGEAPPELAALMAKRRALESEFERRVRGTRDEPASLEPTSESGEHDAWERKRLRSARQRDSTGRSSEPDQSDDARERKRLRSSREVVERRDELRRTQRARARVRRSLDELRLPSSLTPRSKRNKPEKIDLERSEVREPPSGSVATLDPSWRDAHRDAARWLKESRVALAPLRKPKALLVELERELTLSFDEAANRAEDPMAVLDERRRRALESAGARRAGDQDFLSRRARAKRARSES